MNSSEPGCNGVDACALGLISMQETSSSKRKLDIFCPRRWQATILNSSFAFPARTPELQPRLYSGSWRIQKQNIRCFFMSCLFDGLPIKGHQVGLFSLRSKDHWFIRHFESSLMRTILLEMADAAQKRHPDAEAPRCRECDGLMKRDGD